MSAYHGWEHRPKWLGGTDPAGTFPPYHIKLFGDLQVVVSGYRWTLTVPFDMDGLELKWVEAMLSTPSSSGDLTLQIYNAVQGHDMLSTEVQIDSGEYHSADSGTPVVIWSGHEQVFHKDRLEFNIDNAGLGAKGLEVICYFA